MGSNNFMYKVFFIFFLTLFLASCSTQTEKQLKISATTWIGYTPLFYAKAKGWLEPLNIKLINVSSLSENMSVYKAKKSDIYVGTQYEFNHLQDTSIVPIFMFDRSNGGDIVMSNYSIQELQDTNKPIDAYLEIDSINSTLLEDFLARYRLTEKKIHYINKDQTLIAALTTKKIRNPSLLITYIPYNIKLEKNGFKEIASTKNNLNLLVIDAMFTSKKVLSNNKARLLKLKEIINTSITNLQKDPKEFHLSIKPYLLNVSYEEFKDHLNDIVWINTEINQELQKRIEESHFPLRSLL